MASKKKTKYLLMSYDHDYDSLESFDVPTTIGIYDELTQVQSVLDDDLQGNIRLFEVNELVVKTQTRRVIGGSK